MLPFSFLLSSDACIRRLSPQGCLPRRQARSLAQAKIPFLESLAIGNFKWGLYIEPKKHKRLPQGKTIPSGSLRRVPSGFSWTSFPPEGLRLGKSVKLLRLEIHFLHLHFSLFFQQKSRFF
jgi:hypothetical protein